MYETETTQEKLKLLMKIVLPILITQVAMYMVTFFDIYMTARYGTEDLAGVSIGSSFWVPVYIGLAGILMSITPIVAQLMGAKKKDGVKGIYEQAVLVRRVNPGLVAHASMSLLTTVVGQQQLMEVQSSLKSMEKKLETLIQHREHDFAGKIDARFGYFKEVIERFRRNGITLGGVEDAEIEGFYTATLQDLKVLTKDLKAIVASVEGLKEHETLRKWGEAPVKKEYEQLIGRFNAKQELLLLNVQFIQECYEPYLRTIRNYEEADIKSQTLEEIVGENHALIQSIEEKVKSIEENYKVKINFGLKALKYRNLESLKELAPVKINELEAKEQEVPSEVLVEVTEDEQAYAYVPRRK